MAPPHSSYLCTLLLTLIVPLQVEALHLQKVLREGMDRKDTAISKDLAALRRLTEEQRWFAACGSREGLQDSKKAIGLAGDAR